jgi:hypothetical protein
MASPDIPNLSKVDKEQDLLNMFEEFESQMKKLGSKKKTLDINKVNASMEGFDLDSLLIFTKSINKLKMDMASQKEDLKSKVRAACATEYGLVSDQVR